MRCLFVEDSLKLKGMCLANYMAFNTKKGNRKRRVVKHLIAVCHNFQHIVMQQNVVRGRKRDTYENNKVSKFLKDYLYLRVNE